MYYVLYCHLNCFIPGHLSMLQSSMISETPEQFSPPFAASVFTSLLLVLFPPPQSFEHSPTFHTSHSQSTKITNETQWNHVRWILWPIYRIQDKVLSNKIIVTYSDIRECCSFLWYLTIRHSYLHHGLLLFLVL